MADTGPSSILIVGSGVFGLSTAFALAQRPCYAQTRITLLDRSLFPCADASSIDSSRIVRPDYADAAYAALMATAHPAWRGAYAAQGIYRETGLAIIMGEAPEEVGRAFVNGSLENVKELGLKVGRREEGGQIEVLHNGEDVRRVMGTMGGCVGHGGYVNWTSGSADAERGIGLMGEQVLRTGRVEFRTGEVKSLVFEGTSGDTPSVSGVHLANGETIKADLTMLATGAWTPALLDLRGIASASGQALAYLDITPEEQASLCKNPTVIRDDGMFIMPPVRNELKVARHGYGYANPRTIPNPEASAGAADKDITVSLPRTKRDSPDLQIPLEGLQACRDFLAKAIPSLASRPFTHTRICWYTDTPTGDWLVDYHPKYRGLFVATGGSGHAYKFLPVIGERIVDVIRGEDKDDLGRQLRRKWAWPATRFRKDHIWTDDWRGGKKGMILDEELRKGGGTSKL